MIAPELSASQRRAVNRFELDRLDADTSFIYENPARSS